MSRIKSNYNAVNKVDLWRPAHVTASTKCRAGGTDELVQLYFGFGVSKKRNAFSFTSTLQLSASGLCASISAQSPRTSVSV